jgi:hypothetical protein
VEAFQRELHHMKIKEDICKEVHLAQVIQLYEKDSYLA